ncbi:PrpF protein [Aspergillus varians]
MIPRAFQRSVLASRIWGRSASSASASRSQNFLPAAYYRGGTSRAVFFKHHDLPQDRIQWAPIFRGVIGSPDPYGRQLDGLGGGISSLSKVCVVGAPTHPDADVDYTFAALGVKDSDVDYSSNCGNMISAVGPFAVDSGMFAAHHDAKSAVVRIHNTNTGKIIHATFPVVNGEAAATGDLAIDGVAGTGAPIRLDFIHPAGSRTGKLLPTDAVKDTFDGVEATCIDVANPCVFVKAEDLGVSGSITPDQISTTPGLLARLDSIRRQAGAKMGLAESPESIPGSVPKIGMVSALREGHGGPSVDLVVRALSVGQPHKAVPITVALALATAARLPGSTVADVTGDDLVDPAGITIGHASGNVLVGATFGADGQLDYATVFRTARRLFEGRIFWK